MFSVFDFRATSLSSYLLRGIQVGISATSDSVSNTSATKTVSILLSEKSSGVPRCPEGSRHLLLLVIVSPHLISPRLICGKDWDGLSASDSLSKGSLLTTTSTEHLLLKLHALHSIHLPVECAPLVSCKAPIDTHIVHALHVHAEHLGVLLLSELLLDALWSSAGHHEPCVEHSVSLGISGRHLVAHHTHGGHLTLRALVTAITTHHHQSY